MNVTLPKKEKMSKKAIIIYIVAIVICVIAAIVVICSQYFGSGNLDRIIATGTIENPDVEADMQTLKTDFNNILDNELLNKSMEIKVNKMDEDKEIVYTYYEKKEAKENNYDVDLNIPQINIKNNIIEKYNKEIQETFVKKAKDVVKSQNMNSIYSVQYAAQIEDGILSLVIRSNLKDGNSAQRVIVITYNYDLKNNKEISLEELIKLKKLNKNEIQQKIKDSIELEQKKVQDLKSLGYSIFERSSESEIYNIKNTKEFFIKDGKIYLIYAYGNYENTSEMDLVII